MCITINYDILKERVDGLFLCQFFLQVFETFGPVQTPFYSVRFNKESDISDKNIHVGDKVFYAPDIMEYSHFVFVAQLKR